MTVPPDAAGMRFDRFLAARLRQFSRSRLQQLIRDGAATLQGRHARPRDIVHAGEKIELFEPPPEKIDCEPEPIPLAVLFEDEDLIVINKPAGIVTHPGAGHKTHTLVNALLAHCRTLSGIGGKERPGIVHRLDKETSGCLVVAKNDMAHHALSHQFAERSVSKVYLALVAGRLRKKSGVIDAPITRHPVKRQRMTIGSAKGRAARTEYRVCSENESGSVVECGIHSGRTHQIRVHLHHLGHPVLGDKVYAPKLAGKFPRQMLHARRLGFSHPRTAKEMEFTAAIPEDFHDALRQLGLKLSETVLLSAR